MAIQPSGDVTQLLVDWRNGDQEAFNKLMPLVYKVRARKQGSADG